MLPNNFIDRWISEITNDEFIIKKIYDINDLRVQGARNVALAALKILEYYYKKYGIDNKFYDLADLLKNLRPTQVITINVVNEIVTNIKQGNYEIFNNIKQILKEAEDKIAANLLKELILYGKNTIKVMLHCHSSEVIYALSIAKKYGFNVVAYVTETRPKLQGIKTARDLLQNKIYVKYIVDSAAGWYMKNVDMFISGMDSMRREGIVNKIGTYMMALAAKDNNKEVWFVGDYYKLDTREELLIEMRDPKEIIDPKTIKGAEILNPAFDITPWKYIDKVITDRGVIFVGGKNILHHSKL